MVMYHYLPVIPVSHSPQLGYGDVSLPASDTCESFTPTWYGDVSLPDCNTCESFTPTWYGDVSLPGSMTCEPVHPNLVRWCIITWQYDPWSCSPQLGMVIIITWQYDLQSCSPQLGMVMYHYLAVWPAKLFTPTWYGHHRYLAVRPVKLFTPTWYGDHHYLAVWPAKLFTPTWYGDVSLPDNMTCELESVHPKLEVMINPYLTLRDCWVVVWSDSRTVGLLCGLTPGLMGCCVVWLRDWWVVVWQPHHCALKLAGHCTHYADLTVPRDMDSSHSCMVWSAWNLQLSFYCIPVY